MKKEKILTHIEEMDINGLTPACAFARLQALGEPAFLFEFTDEETHRAAYTYLGIRPLETIQCRNGNTYVRTRAPSAPKLGRERKISGNPPEVLEELLSRFTRSKAPGLPPFAGGMIGYLGFEFTRYLEPILDKNLHKTTTDAEFMLMGTLMAFEHAKGRVLLIGTIFLDRETKAEGEKRVMREFKKLRSLVARSGLREKGLTFRVGARAREKLKMKAVLGTRVFYKAIHTIKEKIRRGDLFQCVISEKFQFRLEIDPLRVYAALGKVSPAPYHFYLDFGSSILLGASPERLVSVDGDLIETHPIAGTRPRGNNPASDVRFERQLLASVKERAEHAMLVDLGRNDIGRVSIPGTVSVKHFMQLRKFSHVMHLVSTVQGRLAPRDHSFRALTACFPAGTLSGAPKISAIKTIGGLEPIARGAYGGALILQDFSGRLDSCIIIRSMTVQEGVAAIQAGAGIVADSVAKREYDEVHNKTRSVVMAVELALAGGRK